MQLQRNRAEPNLQQQQLKENIAAVDAEIRKMEKLPEQLRLEEKERMSMLPPSDVVTARVLEKEFDRKVSRSEVSNNRREMQKNFFLMVLLFAAVLAVMWWAYESLKGYGILP